MELTNPSHRSQLSRAINYLNLLKFPLKISISSQPGWQAGTINFSLAGINYNHREFENLLGWQHDCEKEVRGQLCKAVSIALCSQTGNILLLFCSLGGNLLFWLIRMEI